MGRIYSFKTADGSVELPVDGEFLVKGMSPKYSRGECYIAFYDESGKPVAPTAGTATFTSGAFPGQFLEAPENAEIDVTQCGGDATYTPPSFNSLAQSSRLVLSGVTGATTCRAFHWRGN